jgi:hypothetical protein
LRAASVLDGSFTGDASAFDVEDSDKEEDDEEEEDEDEDEEEEEEKIKKMPTRIHSMPSHHAPVAACLSPKRT